MFRCGLCNGMIKAGQATTKVITKRREKIYQDGVGRVMSKGHEIVEEIDSCPSCAKDFQGPATEVLTTAVDDLLKPASAYVRK